MYIYIYIYLSRVDITGIYRVHTTGIQIRVYLKGIYRFYIIKKYRVCIMLTGNGNYETMRLSRVWGFPVTSNT